MTYKTILKKALDYGVKNLKDDVDIAAFFNDLPIPKGHFSRLFYTAYGMTFSHYIRKLKQSHAADDYLKKHDLNALKAYGFESLKALKNSFNLADQDELNDAFLQAQRRMPRMVLPKLMKLEKPILKTLEAKDFVGVPYHGHNPKQAIQRNWERLEARMPEEKTNFIQDTTYGLMAPIRDEGFDLLNPKTGVFSYMCAKEVIEFGHLPKDFKYRMLPKRRYAIFVHKGSLETLRHSYFTIYANALIEEGLTYDEDYVFEAYGPDADLDKDKAHIKIYVPIKP